LGCRSRFSAPFRATPPATALAAEVGLLVASRFVTNPFQPSLIFAPGNRELYVHLGRTFENNADLEMLLAVLSGQAG
jgi:hypothetical protein